MYIRRSAKCGGTSASQKQVKSKNNMYMYNNVYIQIIMYILGGAQNVAGPARVRKSQE